MKICRETPDLCKVGQICRAFYMKTKVGFIVAGYVNWPSLDERATILRSTYVVCLASVPCSPRQCNILRWRALLYSEQRDVWNDVYTDPVDELKFKPSFRGTYNTL